MSTTAGMEALGIKIWPPALQPPNLLAAGQPKAVPDQMYYSTYPTSYPKPASWNTYGVHLPQHYPLQADMGSINDLSFFNSPDGSMNDQKVADDALDFSNLEANLGIFQNGLVSAEEDSSVVNTRKRPLESDQELLTPDTNSSRRMSGSSFSLSSTGATPVDITDVSTYSDTFSYPSDYTPRSSLTLSSSTHLSPVPSPRCPQPERAGSRSKASPSPRPSARTAPYSLDSARKRWSTGSYAPSSALRTSPYLYHSAESFQRTANPSHTSAPTVTSGSVLPSSNLANTSIFGSIPRFHPRPFLLPSNSDSNGKLSSSVRLLSQGPFRTLYSSVDPHGYGLDHYTNLSDPPDLLGPLREEQVPPPEEDMHPEDPELVPHEQELRFENDLYTPRWVRGHGNKREGWCGICKPGRWLVLKNSAFWYDKSFTHGISAATGQAFEGPRETRRMEGNPDIWEGLCGSCGEWIALVSSKKKGTTWFRHAYKCHSHPKIKDAPKRRRESGNCCRPSTANSSSKSTSSTSSVKTESPTPPQAAVTLADSALSGVKTVSPLHTMSSMI